MSITTEQSTWTYQ